MLMKLAFNGAGTDEEFRKKLDVRQRILLAETLMGVLVIATGILMMIIGPQVEKTAFLAGLYCGIGSVAVVVGGINLRKIQKMRKDEALLHRERIKESDERSSEIAKQAAAASVLIFLFFMLAAIIVSGFFSMQIFWTLWGTTIGLCVIVKLTELYYKKNM